jgi:hypothetical protein
MSIMTMSYKFKTNLNELFEFKPFCTNFIAI